MLVRNNNMKFLILNKPLSMKRYQIILIYVRLKFQKRACPFSLVLKLVDFMRTMIPKELNMHAKCVTEDNNEAGIRANKTYLALCNEVGGSSNLNFSEKDVGNYITCKLRTSDPNLEAWLTVCFIHWGQSSWEIYFSWVYFVRKRRNTEFRVAAYSLVEMHG
ncbi:hypothetical protein PIB30_066457 [Stylosanthes scabra]|uniref:Uncharacterized protein n=1 Tax=Stylosanthes scabra TaxID=79078 RepID=A0ABU6RMA0_9FABA|nr:hypothetical protein [Stylosanthes scabra]